MARGAGPGRNAYCARVYTYSPPRTPGVRVFAAPHPGARAFSPSPGLHSDPPLRGSRFGGATRWPPRCGRPVGGRIDVTGGADGYAYRIGPGCMRVRRLETRVYACLRLPTQGCGPSALPTQGRGPSALPLGCLGIHPLAVLGSAGPRDGRRFAAGRLVRGITEIGTARGFSPSPVSLTLHHRALG